MTTQPEALRLADNIEAGYYGHCPQAAAELRRLHEEVQEQCRLNGMGSEREARLMAINQELLEALRYLVAVYDKGTCGATVEIGFNQARAAIAKATGEQA